MREEQLMSCVPGQSYKNFAGDSFAPFQACTPGRLADLVAAVQQAEALQFHAHAFGALWSFSGCAITFDFMIDTRSLTEIFSFTNPGAAVQRALTADAGDPELLVHVEAGISLKAADVVFDVPAGKRDVVM
jgi:hypothetical protein